MPTATQMVQRDFGAEQGLVILSGLLRKRLRRLYDWCLALSRLLIRVVPTRPRAITTHMLRKMMARVNTNRAQDV